MTQGSNPGLHIAGRFFPLRATREVPHKWISKFFTLRHQPNTDSLAISPLLATITHENYSSLLWTKKLLVQNTTNSLSHHSFPLSFPGILGLKRRQLSPPPHASLVIGHWSRQLGLRLLIGYEWEPWGGSTTCVEAWPLRPEALPRPPRYGSRAPAPRAFAFTLAESRFRPQPWPWPGWPSSPPAPASERRSNGELVLPDRPGRPAVTFRPLARLP